MANAIQKALNKDRIQELQQQTALPITSQNNNEVYK